MTEKKGQKAEDVKKTVIKVEEPQPFGMVTNGQFLRPEGIPRMRDKVCIVGFAPSSMLDTRVYFEDPTWEIWGINQLYLAFPGIVKHASRWFQIHPRTEYDMAVRDVKHHQWLAEQTSFPIYMQIREPDIPMAIPYPLEQILGKFVRKYFTNTISWQIALAILEGFSEINIFGVDMAQDEEYCLSPKMRILTADLQWVKAENTYIGQKIVAFDEFPRTQTEEEGIYRQYEEATIENKTALIRPCYKLTMEDGTELISSAEHRWLSFACHERRWLETECLQGMDIYPQRASKIVKLMDTWEPDNSWGAGYLAAGFDGEGNLCQTSHKHCASYNMRMGFAQKKNDMSKTVDAELDARNFRYSKNDDDCQKYNLKGGRPEMLRFLGQIRPKRLLEIFDANRIGTLQRAENINISKIEFIGNQEVIALKTSKGTMIVEGFASHNSEQRPSCEYFVGWADALGIKVNIPAKSDLCKTVWLYPFEDDNPFRQKIDARRGELRQRVNETAQNEQGLHDQRMQLLGALDNMNYIQKTWSNAVREQTPGQMIQKR